MTYAVRTLLRELVFGEGPRWHDGALYLSDMHARRVLRVSLTGEEAAVVDVSDDEPSGLGWLPDGRLLIVAMETQRLLRLEDDGSLVTHADLSSVARGSLNDMIVSETGVAYVGDMGVRIHDEAGARRPGQTFRVMPDGCIDVAADDLRSPNGHVLTDDGTTLIVAESGGAQLTAFDVAAGGTLSGRRVFAPLRSERPGRVAVADGICLDREGAVWFADPLNACVSRVLEGGQITDVVRFDDVMPVACVLGGPDRRTLFMCVAADWRRDTVTKARTGRIDACEVAIAGAGRP